MATTTTTTAPIEPIYSSYYEVIQQITSSPSKLPRFKENPQIIGMYEHVNTQFGREYYTLLQNTTTIGQEAIQRYCKMNDCIGGGAKSEYEPQWDTSPSNFRYLYHAHLILTHLRSFFPDEEWISKEIVEVGCGYGGLAIAVCELAPLYRVRIPAYHLIDLPDSAELQKRYHREVQHYYPFGAETVFTYHSAFEYGKDLSDKTDMFLISNYCFSEISAEHQEQYRIHLLKTPIVTHGFMAWNHIPLYDFGYGDKVRYEKENPFTGAHNLYVYF